MQYPASMRPGPVSRGAALEEILTNVLYLIALLLLGKLLSWTWRLRCSYSKPAVKKKQPAASPRVAFAHHSVARKRTSNANKKDNVGVATGSVVRQRTSACIYKDDTAPKPGGVPAKQQVQDILVDTHLRPQHSRRIDSRDEFWHNVRVGQHYAVQRSLLGIYVFHHFLVTEVSPLRDYAKVIHYNGTARRYIETAKKVFGEVVENIVRRDDDDLLDIPLHLYIVNDPMYSRPAACSVTAAEDAVLRARRRLGESRYGVTYNNCEHFVRWALTGLPRSDQYELTTVSHKVIGSLVDELPHFGFHLLFKCVRDAVFGVTSAIEAVILEGGARLVRHTAEASLPAMASTAAATAGLAAPAEAAYLAYRILDMKRSLAAGTLNRRDYDNAKDKAITSAVLSLVCSTCGAVVGQLVIPLPLLGAVLGSFWGGVIGRLVGATVAAFGIALKEKYYRTRS